MSKKKKISLMLWLFFFGFITFACQAPLLRKSTCPIENFLIDPINLPGDQWEEVGSRSYRDAPSRLGIDRIGTSFSTPTHGVVIEDIYRFWNVKDTQDGYNELKKDWFGSEPEGTTWTKLEIPNDVLISANEYRLECSARPNQNGRSCWYISRYENTVVELKADMLIIKNTDLVNIIVLIDQQIMKCSETQP